MGAGQEGGVSLSVTDRSCSLAGALTAFKEDSSSLISLLLKIKKKHKLFCHFPASGPFSESTWQLYMTGQEAVL